MLEYQARVYQIAFKSGAKLRKISIRCYSEGHFFYLKNIK